MRARESLFSFSFSLACAIAVVSVSGCGQSTTPSDDDSGLPPTDSGPGHDTGMPGNDTGVPPIDTGVVPVDTGVPSPDAAMPVDAAPPESCTTAGATETVPCGMCGTVTRFCTSSLTWAYGSCTGEAGECVPGTASTVACGNCGTRAASCDATCHWTSTAPCTGEGACAPGNRTRTGTGCPAGQTQELLCNTACSFQPTGSCMADGCPTPGATENAPCGMCGTVSRFCDVSHVWQYGTCTGEGACMPGTMGTQSCGMCGMQTTRCDTACHSAAFGSCTGEGTCTPGATTITATGCPAGQMHQMRCDGACGYTIEVTPCASTRPVDVTFLLDVTGSNNPALTAAIAPLENNCIMPLLALMDVQVGVSFMGEFPNTPYGQAGDRPFVGGVEPTTTYATLATAITGRPVMVGGDGSDATVPALSMLTGGPMESSSTPLVCSSGRTSGGCWRPGAARIIVVHSDSPMHGGPPGVDMPYTTIVPNPAQWPAVLAQLQPQHVTLVWFDSTVGGTGSSTSQMQRTLVDLAQPATDRHATTSAAAVTTACAQLVAQVRTIAGL